MPLIAAHEIELEGGNEAIYNGLDAPLTHEQHIVQNSFRLNETLIYDFERGMQAPALEMMRRGFLVDISAREKALTELENSAKEYQDILTSILEVFNSNIFTEKFSNSDKQLRHLFYNCMKLKPIERTRNGETKQPMDRETLEKLLTVNSHAEIIIRLVTGLRDRNKSRQVLSTEIENDWRWHCSYNPASTATGRWSSSKYVTGTGNNFQNITEELRRVFIPDLGFKLYGIDKKQSEAHDVAWFCGTVLGDWSYFDACMTGDLHTYTTRLTYPDWNWTGDLRKDRDIAERKFYRHLSYRDTSKRIGHGSNYMGQARELAKQTRIPQHLVEDFQERYFTAFPCISLMHQWVRQEIQRVRYLINSYGRRRDFFGYPNSNDTIKAAVAYLFQSATGDCVNLGLWRLWKNMGTRIQILAQLHDAIYFQAPIPVNDNAEQDLLREALENIEITQHDPISDKKMRIPGEVVGGFNWAHKFRRQEDGTLVNWNPNGLIEIKVAA